MKKMKSHYFRSVDQKVKNKYVRSVDQKVKNKNKVTFENLTPVDDAYLK
jgi:hypothetical protein